jgi:hypothetical protein
MLASIAQKRARLDFNERKEKPNGPVPLFVLVIAPIPVLSAPLCVSGPNAELTWPSMMLRRQTNGEAVLIRLSTQPRAAQMVPCRRDPVASPQNSLTISPLHFSFALSVFPFFRGASSKRAWELSNWGQLKMAARQSNKSLAGWLSFCFHRYWNE